MTVTATAPQRSAAAPHTDPHREETDRVDQHPAAEILDWLVTSDLPETCNWEVELPCVWSSRTPLLKGQLATPVAGDVMIWAKRLKIAYAEALACRDGICWTRVSAEGVYEGVRVEVWAYLDRHPQLEAVA